MNQAFETVVWARAIIGVACIVGAVVCFCWRKGEKPAALPKPQVPVHVQEEREAYFERVADAIYWAEGGPKTRFPYGVKLYQGGVAAPAQNPRAMCLDIIRWRFRDWKEACARPAFSGDFIGFLAQRYCPAVCDPEGQRHWIKNVRWFLQYPKAV